jgi:hypothetical protein
MEVIRVNVDLICGLRHGRDDEHWLACTPGPISIVISPQQKLHSLCPHEIHTAIGTFEDGVFRPCATSAP